jgi:hypothetical protein
MAEETEISTPEVETVETTSSDEVVDTTTSNDEVTDSENAAETETEEGEETTSLKPSTQNEGVLLAGKYKTVDELVKGYQELNKSYTQSQQIKSKYNELLKQQEAQNAIRLEKAKEQGFNSIQEQEINERIMVEEFNDYARAINTIAPEYFEQARQNLLDYYTTANKAYLNEAKKYFPSEFIEQVALKKQDLEQKLKGEYQQKADKERVEQEQKLAETLKEDYAEFLSDLKENTSKAKALQMFCNAGFIQSVDDMKVFTDIYNGIANYAKDLAIKEYEAAKAIKETTDKAVIDGGGNASVDLNTMPTIEQLSKMSQQEYDKAIEKYGHEKLFGGR